MLAERYLRWCVFGYGMESAGFTALKNEVNRVRNCVIQYDELVELVKSAQRTLGQEWKGFSREKKEDVDDLLEQAEQKLGKMCTRERLKEVIAEARRLLQEAETCEEKGRSVAAPAGVQGSEKVATDGRTFKLLWSGFELMGFNQMWVELRLYGDQIETWVDDVKDTVLSETIARQLYPRMKTAEAATTGGGPQLLDMSHLLRRMQDVRET